MLEPQREGVRERKAAQTSLASFTARMFTGYTTSAYITDVLIPALEWAVNTPNARLIVTMPPRHSKSLNVSENFPAWYLGRHPDQRIIAASLRLVRMNSASIGALIRSTISSTRGPSVCIN